MQTVPVRVDVCHLKVADLLFCLTLMSNSHDMKWNGERWEFSSIPANIDRTIKSHTGLYKCILMTKKKSNLLLNGQKKLHKAKVY